MSKNCIITTVKSKIKGNAISYIERESEIFIPISKKFTLKQTRAMAQDKVNIINKEYLSEKFGEVVSLNSFYTDGTGINIHPSQRLVDAYEVKEGNKTIEQVNSNRNLKYFNEDEALLEQEQNEDNLIQKELDNLVEQTNNIEENEITTPEIKEGVSELFESNSELANSIYETLGFDKQINEIADTKKVNEFIKKYKDALPNIKDGKTLISHLQTISNRNTGTTKQFADLIIKFSKSNKSLEKLLNNPNLYAKPNSVGDEGAFHWSLFSNLSVNKIVLELDHFKTNTYDDVFLHELIHNLTTQFIVKGSDLFNQEFHNKVKSLYDVFDKHLENNRKVDTSFVKMSLEELQNYKKVKEYFEFLPDDAIQQELIFGKIGSISTIKGAKLDFSLYEGKSKQEVLDKLDEIIKYRENNLKKREKGDKDYYYFNSETFEKDNVLSEFLATFINDSNFREQLKIIDYKNNKSIFQTIIDLISEFLGLTKNDSLYNEFVLNLTNFINNNDYSTIAKQTLKTAYENRINLLEQQKQQAQQLYAQYLESLNKPNTNPILQGNQTNIEEIITQLEKDGLLEIDCKGKLKAEKGLATSFTKGGKWEIYEIFEGKSHKQGGIDINIKNNQISFTNKNGSIKAKYGLVIPKDN